MKMIKLHDKNNNAHIFVFVEKNKIIRNKHNFVIVKNHPSNVETINENIINRYYNIPRGIEL